MQPIFSKGGPGLLVGWRREDAGSQGAERLGIPSQWPTPSPSAPGSSLSLYLRPTWDWHTVGAQSKPGPSLPGPLASATPPFRTLHFRSGHLGRRACTGVSRSFRRQGILGAAEMRQGHSRLPLWLFSAVRRRAAQGHGLFLLQPQHQAGAN